MSSFVGAGPTGLVLALWLTRFGVHVRIVDKAPVPGRTSRARGVQARTLQLYQQMGLPASMVERGRPLVAANLWVLGRHRGRLEFGALGNERSAFPYMLMVPQDEHEALLVQHLAAAGVAVERPVEATRLEPKADHVLTHLRHPDGGLETCEAAYVAGCDGAHSFVRQALQVDYPGGTYARLFYVADVEATGPTMNGELHVAWDDADILACFPLKAPSRARLVGTVMEEAENAPENLDWSVVHKRVIERVHLEVKSVHWFSTYRVHHRVASAFRVGRVFLLGDAAHIHSPLGGQGMNTGIGDAVNLAWKLSATLRQRADAQRLDSYADERAPFARRLVHTTDRAFELVSSTGLLADCVRKHVAPRLLTTLFRWPQVRRFAFNALSQIKVSYRGVGLNEGALGPVRGGDCLPWVRYDGGDDNFELRADGSLRIGGLFCVTSTLSTAAKRCAKTKTLSAS